VTDPGEVSQAIARHVRALRAARGWSIDALAARSGVSRGMVIQIEQARTNPSVATLVRLADALGATLSSLVDPGEPAAVRVIPAAGRITLWRSPAGGIAELLAGTDSEPLVELWRWRMFPGDRYASEAHPPRTVEMISVSSGELRLEVAGEAYEVVAGQVAVFRSDRDHAYAHRQTDEPGPQETSFLMVVCTPPPPDRTLRPAS
jgi:transcriptional regulator with XRE-family HTH domain